MDAPDANFPSAHASLAPSQPVASTSTAVFSTPAYDPALVFTNGAASSSHLGKHQLSDDEDFDGSLQYGESSELGDGRPASKKKKHTARRRGGRLSLISRAAYSPSAVLHKLPGSQGATARSMFREFWLASVSGRPAP